MRVKVRGQQRIASKKSASLSLILASAIESKNQFIEKTNSKTIKFSNYSFWGSLYRYDCFSGVRNGEIEILPEKEGKATVVFTLDISTSSLLLLLVTLGNMFTWPLMNTGLLSALLKDELTILLISVAAFFLWREYLRSAMKFFISRTLKDLQ